MVLKKSIPNFFIGFKQSISYRFLIMATLINVVFLPFHCDFFYFVLRQCFVFVGVIIHFKMGVHIQDLLKQDDQIFHLTTYNYPVLKHDNVIILLGFVCSLLQLFSPFIAEEFTSFLLVLSGLWIWLFTISTCIKIYAIVVIPELRPYYDVVKSIYVSVIFSFSTFSKIFHLLKFFSRILGGGLLCSWFGPKIIVGNLDFRGVLWNDFTYLFLGFRSKSWAGPKIIHGNVDYRGSLWNEITYPFTGIRTRSDAQSAAVDHLILHRGGDQFRFEVITDVTNPETGYVDQRLLNAQYKKYGVPPANITIIHKPSWPDWPWK